MCIGVRGNFFLYGERGAEIMSLVPGPKITNMLLCSVDVFYSLFYSDKIKKKMKANIIAVFRSDYV